jgi:glycosyltransferase involved in cell wall biosynthesis
MTGLCDPEAGGMRLLLVVTKGSMGGAQRYVASLAEGFQGRGWEVEVAFGVGEGLGAWCSQRGIPVHRAALDNPINPLKDAWATCQLARIMKRGRFDVVHLNSTKAGIDGLAASRLARVPVRVFTAHGLRSVLLPSAGRRRFWAWMESRYLRTAGCVIAVSDFELGEGRRNGALAPGQSVRIHNGVSLARVEAGARAGRRRTDLGLSDADLVVGTVTRLDYAKGISWWLRAARLISDQEPRAHFVIVGDGRERHNLTDFANRLGLQQKLVWAGQQEGVEYLPLFDVFMQSSLYEGLSLALLEAMAARLPVVATGVGGNPEAVQHGETGWLVPARNEQALAQAALSLLRDDQVRRAMGERGRALVEQEFTEEMMVARVAALYQDLLSGRVGAGSP